MFEARGTLLGKNKHLKSQSCLFFFVVIGKIGLVRDRALGYLLTIC